MKTQQIIAMIAMESIWDEVFIPVWSQARPIKTCKLDEIGTREGWVRFSLPITSRTDSTRVREMINSLTTHLKEETSEDIEHKVWCVTKQTHNREKKRPQSWRSSTLLWTSSKLRWRIWQ